MNENNTCPECGRLLAICGTCFRQSCLKCNPTPAGRCPYEYDHEDIDYIESEEFATTLYIIVDSNGDPLSGDFFRLHQDEKLTVTVESVHVTDDGTTLVTLECDDGKDNGRD